MRNFALQKKMGQRAEDSGDVSVSPLQRKSIINLHASPVLESSVLPSHYQKLSIVHNYLLQGITMEYRSERIFVSYFSPCRGER